MNSLVRSRSSVMLRSIFSRLCLVSICASSQSCMIFLASLFFWRSSDTSLRISLNPSHACRFSQVLGSRVRSTLWIRRRYSIISFFLIGYFFMRSWISAEFSLGTGSTSVYRLSLASFFDSQLFVFGFSFATIFSALSLRRIGVLRPLSPGCLSRSECFCFAYFM